jgi:UDP-N-acetylglucosamine 2-epimerase (non-hydrolysing)
VKVINICGARPNFMKIAPLMRAFAQRPEIDARIVHTGQHYDDAMSKSFFDDLHIPRPDINLEVGSASHAVQTALIMQRFEPVMLAEKPDAVLVVGDVNSTIACGLVAAKLQVPLVHVEAGLRSFDRTMPEEVNRVLTDAISDLLFVTEPAGVENLLHEGVAREKIHLVGNVMIDTLLAHREMAEKSDVLERLKLSPQRYGVLTLHRPSNVDDPRVLAGILDALQEIQAETPLVFPVHPRTRGNLERSGLAARLAGMRGLSLIEPLGYLDFLKLMSRAAVVLTDSGGIQEETTVLGVPCLTLRANTERPVTAEHGTNQVVGMSPERIVAAYRRVREGKVTPRVPELWDGRAAERIAEILVRWHGARVAPNVAPASCR